MDVCHAQSENNAEAICCEPVGIVQRPAAARFPFMNEKSIQLTERRERLVAQAAAQRMALAQNIELWRIPLARAYQGLAALRYIKSHPRLDSRRRRLACGAAAWPRRKMAGARLGNVADNA